MGIKPLPLRLVLLQKQQQQQLVLPPPQEHQQQQQRALPPHMEPQHEPYEPHLPGLGIMLKVPMPQQRQGQESVPQRMVLELQAQQRAEAIEMVSTSARLLMAYG
jgi:hypothetical protein